MRQIVGIVLRLPVTFSEVTMSKVQICKKCGHRGDPKIVTKGSIFIEFVLWLALLIPGVIYSIWRLTAKYAVCPQCGAPNMLQINSPNGNLSGESGGNVGFSSDRLMSARGRRVRY
jgi:ribosomal protein L32